VANTVSVGSSTNLRRIVNVANPTGAHDAVTLGYLQSNYSTSAAFSALSAEINAVNKQVASIQTAQARVMQTASMSPAAAGAATPAAASAAPAATPASAQTQAAVASANQYTDQQTQEALQSAKVYTNAASAQTLSAANAYTNAALSSYVTTDQFSQFQAQVGARFNQQDQRIDKLGAMNAASTQMAINTAGLDGDNRVGIGGGTYNGQQAGSVGYEHMFNNHHASVSVGATVGGGQTSGGVGVGFSW
jgi:hypothetical protein